MILDSEKSRFCLSFLCFIRFICLSGVGKICLMGNQVCRLSRLSGHKTLYPVYKSLYIRIYILTLLSKFILRGLITESHKRLQATLGKKHH